MSELNWQARWPVAAAAGFLISLAVHLAALAFTVGSAPRSRTGAPAVTLSWQEYAWSAIAGPLAAMIFAGLLLPRGRSARIAFFVAVAAAACVFWFGFDFLNLLRRDHAGKF